MEEKIEQLTTELGSIKELLSTEIAEIKHMLFFINEGLLENRAILRTVLEEIEDIKLKDIKPGYEKSKSVVKEQERVEAEIADLFGRLKARSKIKMENNQVKI